MTLSRRTLLTAAALAPAAPALAAPADAKGPTLPRSDFGFARGLTFINTAAAGPTPRSIRKVMEAAWDEIELDPVTQVYSDTPARARTDAARADLAALINARPEELLITRSTTEAMNVLAAGLKLDAGDRILTTDQEHQGALLCWRNLGRRRGVVLDTVSLPPELLDNTAVLDRIERAITPRTRVIAISQVFFTDGRIMPVREIAALARAKGVFCAIDGAQAVGQIPVDVAAIGCDAYVAPGHKWVLGPKGTGFLHLSKTGTDLCQPVQRDSGPVFVNDANGVGCAPLLVGLGAAASAMRGRGLAAVQARTLVLRNLAHAGLASIPKLRLVSPPPGHPMASALISARLPDGLDHLAFRTRMRLEHKVILKTLDPSVFSGLRLSPHIFNDEADVERTIAAIGRVLG